MNVARAFNIQYKEFHYFSFLVGRSLSNERTQISVRFYNYSIWYNELMLSQSRQHNYVYRHNIRPCPLLCSLPAILFLLSLSLSLSIVLSFPPIYWFLLSLLTFIWFYFSQHVLLCVTSIYLHFLQTAFSFFLSHPMCVCLFVSAVAFGSCTQNITLV